MNQNSERDKEIKANQQKVLEAEQKKMGQLVQCVGVAASTPEGIIAFRQLMCMCGYNLSCVVGDAKIGIDVNGTLYNAARENIWKEFRQLIPVKARKKIEYEKTVYTDEGGE